MSDSIYDQISENNERKNPDGLEFLGEIEDKLQQLKTQSQMLQNLRASSGGRSQKVLDFRSFQKPQKDLAEFKIAQGKQLMEAEKKVKERGNASLKSNASHAQVYGMPTGKTMDSKQQKESSRTQDKQEDDMINMDDEKLRLIWNRMFNMSMNVSGDKISRIDFLERIFLEMDLKDFYELLQEPIMDDFVAFYSQKLDVMYPGETWFGYKELKKFLPKANKLYKIDVAPSNSDRNHETMLKIENKYNIVMTSDLAKKQRKEKQELNKKITIPRPFSFVDKKKEHKSIMQTKLEKDLEEKEKNIKLFQNWQFKSNPVPAECLIPLMNTLDANREKRIQNFKDFNATKNNMKVFSFVERDQEEEGKKMEKVKAKYEHEPYSFKAKLIPTAVSLPLYDDMVAEKKYKSQQNIEKRKVFMQKISSLPERMKRAEENKFARTKKRAKDDTNLDNTFIPNINHSVPDFKRKQEAFKQKLESKKNVHEKIQPKEFNMTKREAEKEKIRNTMNRTMSQATVKKPRINQAQQSLANFEKAKQQAKKAHITSTKKFEDTKKQRLIERQEKEKKELDERAKEMLRKEKYNEMKSEFTQKMKNYRAEEEDKLREKMGDTLVTVDKIKDLVHQKKIDTRINEEEYKQQLKEIEQRVKSRDPLISNYDEKNQKRRTRAKLLLQQYNDMIKNGFTNPSKFLTKEELILIEEERLRQNMLDKNQLISLEKSKHDRLNKLHQNRTFSDEDRREIQRLEYDLILIEEKKREIGIKN